MSRFKTDGEFLFFIVLVFFNELCVTAAAADTPAAAGKQAKLQ